LIAPRIPAGNNTPFIGRRELKQQQTKKQNTTKKKESKVLK